MESNDEWTLMLQLLSEFKALYGDCRIPENFIYKGRNLHRWFNEVMSRYRNAGNGPSLSDREAQQLEQILQGDSSEKAGRKNDLSDDDDSKDSAQRKLFGDFEANASVSELEDDDGDGSEEEEDYCEDEDDDDMRKGQKSQRKDKAAIRQSNEAAWDEMLQGLVDFHKANGHFNVPVDAMHAGKSLYHWFKNQKQYYVYKLRGKGGFGLSDVRVQKLEAAGVDLESIRQKELQQPSDDDTASAGGSLNHEGDASVQSEKAVAKRDGRSGSKADKERRWDEMLEAVVDFRKKNGHLRFPMDMEHAGIKLYGWWHNQKNFYRNRSKGSGFQISDQRVRKLESAGLLSEIIRSNSSIALDTDQSGPGGGGGEEDDESSVVDEEDNEEDNESSADEEKVVKPHVRSGSKAEKERLWDEMLAAVVDFQQKNGHLRIPKGMQHAGRNLERWWDNQKTFYGNRIKGSGFQLSDQRVRKLERAGLVSELIRPNSKIALKTDQSEPDVDDDGEEEDNESSADEQEAVDHSDGRAAIKAEQERRWDEMLAAVLDFREKNGHLRIPKGMQHAGRNLHVWWGNQKTFYGNKIKGSGGQQLSDLRVRKLEEAGLSFDVIRPRSGIASKKDQSEEGESDHDEEYELSADEEELPQRSVGKSSDKRSKEEVWDSMLEGLLEFKRQNGHLNPPRSVLWEGKNLYFWFRDQRRYFQNKCRGVTPSLSDARERKLREAGVDLDDDAVGSNEDGSTGLSAREVTLLVDEYSVSSLATIPVERRLDLRPTTRADYFGVTPDSYGSYGTIRVSKVLPKYAGRSWEPLIDSTTMENEIVPAFLKAEGSSSAETANFSVAMEDMKDDPASMRVVVCGSPSIVNAFGPFLLGAFSDAIARCDDRARKQREHALEEEAKNLATSEGSSLQSRGSTVTRPDREVFRKAERKERSALGRAGTSKRDDLARAQEADELPGAESLVSMQAVDKNFAFYNHFEGKYKELINLEFKGSGIHPKFVVGRMWDQHKRLLGYECSEACDCVFRIKELSSTVVKDKLSKNDGKWSNPLRLSAADMPVGLMRRFAPNFMPRLKEEYPEESPVELLGRLPPLWEIHKRHRKYGNVCGQRCECASAWNTTFGLGSIVCESVAKRPKVVSSIPRKKRKVVEPDAGGHGALLSSNSFDSVESPESVRKEYDVVFRSTEPLGLYCITKRDTSQPPTCTVISLFPSGQAVSERRIQNGTVIVAAQVGGELSNISTCDELRTCYEQAKSTSEDITLTCVNEQVTDESIERMGALQAKAWTISGAWKGRVLGGFDGGAPPRDPIAKPPSLRIAPSGAPEPIKTEELSDKVLAESSQDNSEASTVTPHSDDGHDWQVLFSCKDLPIGMPKKPILREGSTMSERKSVRFEERVDERAFRRDSVSTAFLVPSDQSSPTLLPASQVSLPDLSAEEVLAKSVRIGDFVETPASTFGTNHQGSPPNDIEPESHATKLSSPVVTGEKQLSPLVSNEPKPSLSPCDPVPIDGSASRETNMESVEASNEPLPPTEQNLKWTPPARGDPPTRPNQKWTPPARDDSPISRTSDDGLPSLDRTWPLPSKKRTFLCKYDSTRSAGCWSRRNADLKGCKFIHIAETWGDYLDVLWEKVPKCISMIGLSRQDFLARTEVRSEQLSSGTWWTAAYVNVTNHQVCGQEIIHAEQGEGSQLSSLGVYWYPSRDLAMKALEKTVTATLYGRHKLGLFRPQKTDVQSSKKGVSPTASQPSSGSKKVRNQDTPRSLSPPSSTGQATPTSNSVNNGSYSDLLGNVACRSGSQALTPTMNQNERPSSAGSYSALVARESGSQRLTPTTNNHHDRLRSLSPPSSGGTPTSLQAGSYSALEAKESASQRPTPTTNTGNQHERRRSLSPLPAGHAAANPNKRRYSDLVGETSTTHMDSKRRASDSTVSYSPRFHEPNQHGEVLRGDFPLANNWLEEQGKKRCHHFKKSGQCDFGRNCQFLHVTQNVGAAFSHRAVHIPDHEWSLYRHHIRIRESVFADGRNRFTAGYCYANEVFYAEGGLSGMTSTYSNSCHIFWYPTAKEAEDALRRVISAARGSQR